MKPTSNDPTIVFIMITSYINYMVEKQRWILLHNITTESQIHLTVYVIKILELLLVCKIKLYRKQYTGSKTIKQSFVYVLCIKVCEKSYSWNNFPSKLFNTIRSKKYCTSRWYLRNFIVDSLVVAYGLFTIYFIRLFWRNDNFVVQYL